MAHSGFNVVDDIMRLKKRIADIYADQSRSFIIRSRIQHIESNENVPDIFLGKCFGLRLL